MPTVRGAIIKMPYNKYFYSPFRHTVRFISCPAPFVVLGTSLILLQGWAHPLALSYIPAPSTPFKLEPYITSLTVTSEQRWHVSFLIEALQACGKAMPLPLLCWVYGLNRALLACACLLTRVKPCSERAMWRVIPQRVRGCSELLLVWSTCQLETAWSHLRGSLS